MDGVALLLWGQAALALPLALFYSWLDRALGEGRSGNLLRVKRAEQLGSHLLGWQRELPRFPFAGPSPEPTLDFC